MAQYEFSDKFLPDNFDELVTIVDQTKPIVSDYTEYDLEAFTESSRFASLPAADKAKVIKLFTVLTSDNDSRWGLDRKVLMDDLFPYIVPTAFEQVTSVDAYVISGACGSDVLYDAEDLGMKLESIPQDLDTLRIIGALAANSFNSFEGWESITINGDTKIMIGADFHGDFRMTHRKIRDKVCLTPDGDILPFVPVTYEMIAGYHSVEEDIVDSLLEHMASRMNDSEKKDLYAEITNNNEWGQKTKGDNPFGDYGGGEHNISFLPTWDEQNTDTDGSILRELRVSPSPRSQIQLTVASDAGGVRIMQRERAGDKDLFKVLSQVYIPNKDLVIFIRALGLSDKGRTSPAQIKRLLEMKLLGKHSNGIN